ncbi:hypothetical protein OH146_08320 [Salinibacterium sp. SYSU T00001]|uniref:hypothetical protein n=1 Tax=Homoserinimonas sedimenticola TaxID=2986805 RepID=UPI0022360168|nr:hypothetical protein [Salinibacterium sedimenticola]MCW4385779.1 hypothetical protein [Salinibacterium sedimenticola]
MSDGLTISGGGSIRVSTEEMAENAAHLRRYAEAAGASCLRLGAVERAISEHTLVTFDAPLSAARADATIDDCVTTLTHTRLQAQALVAMLDIAATSYGLAERANEIVARHIAATLAYALGRVYPLILTWLTPHLLGAAGAWFLTPEERQRRVIDWLGAHSGMLSDPRVVELLRLSVSSVDEFGAGALRVPPELLGLLGDEALGVLGFGASASVLLGTVRSLGLARETEVSVARTNLNVHRAAPGGFEDLAKNIPAHSEQIRVDRVPSDAGPDRFIVYIGGTREGSLSSGTEPFDGTSNLGGMAQGAPLSIGDTGSMQAVRLAMEQAGVTAETPVYFVGYSQGAITGVSLAESGDYTVEGIFTVGGPTGELDVPDGAPYLALEHEEDIITSLGGLHRDNDTVVVRRAVFEGEEPPKDSLLPAHSLARYRESSALLDAAHEPRIAEAGAHLREFVGGASKVESSTYLARREGQSQ